MSAKKAKNSEMNVYLSVEGSKIIASTADVVAVILWDLRHFIATLVLLGVGIWATGLISLITTAITGSLGRVRRLASTIAR